MAVSMDLAWKLSYLCMCLTTFLQPGRLQRQLLTGDVSSLNQTDQLCVNDIPSNVTVTSFNSTQASISWAATFPNGTNATGSEVLGYEILYWPRSTTTYMVHQVPTETEGVILKPLSSFTKYAVVVRLYCSPGNRSGRASPITEFTTSPASPGATINEVSVEVNYQGVNNHVRLSWDAIPEDQWNGRPKGYFIYLYSPSTSNTPFYFRVAYPNTEYILSLADGRYAVQVVPVNAEGGVAEGQLPAGRTEFNVLGNSTSLIMNPSILSYPYIYILVPGVLFVVIIAAIAIVLFKKSIERWRLGVQYCKEIDEPPLGQMNPLHPLQSLSPRTPSSSASLPLNPTIMTNRPLPRSPMSDPGATLQTLPEEVGMFGNGATVAAPARKIPHPGPMPQLKESSEVGFVPMTRTYTDQSNTSVFTSTQAHTHASQHTNPRSNPRANQRSREAGDSIPSPYEVPENGSTLSRTELKRPSSAHAVLHHRAHNIPPPPSHSPPTLTHGNEEVFPQVAMAGHHFGHGRGIPQRSFSTTTADGLMAGDSSRGKPMLSDSNLPTLDSAFERGQEQMVYIRPPLDSSLEHSINGGTCPADEGVGFEVKSSPIMMYAPGQTNGSITTASSEPLSSFSETTDPYSMPAGPIPRHPGHHPRPPHQHQSDRSAGRQGRSESEFSETSTEMSNSGSIREVSPGVLQWDFPHRGTASDIGVGHHRQRSHSPAGRENFSEVGGARPTYRHGH